MHKKALPKFLFILFFFISFTASGAEEVKIDRNQLVVDGVYQPQLFGAEIQYFRLRGGVQKNIPREKVLKLWDKALDHAVEAGMNAISFYIPWDFHEYQEGKFDFDGTVDEDGDGSPDYPSRDVKTFIEMIRAKGITRIMARPGPYINAEWGFLGFGAIPYWFHKKFPDSHMRNAEGLKTKLYDYHSPELLTYTRLWFEKVYQSVLKPHIGPGGPILFLQLDNETNYMWQSIYNHDYGPRAIDRYRDFLKNKFLFISDLNSSHNRNWNSWNDIRPPVTPGLNPAEDKSWYEFQDYSMFTYLKSLRKIWEDIGVREPAVMFNLAESYNAMKNGILPNFEYKNAKDQTGMMTMNLYPKTYEVPEVTLMNLPFKGDHDAKSVDAANDAYTGSANEWLMGPEIQGGWWRNVPVSLKSRQQTYLTTIGQGLKALFIYYFTEGNNWQAGWARDQIQPLYDKLKAENVPASEFWNKLQREVDTKILVGFDVYRIMNDPEASEDTLFFDAPLDDEANPRAGYTLLKNVGLKIVKPHEDFLAEAVRIEDSVTIFKSDKDHAPSNVPGIDTMLMNVDWAGGLLGYVSQLGFSPKIHIEDISSNQKLLESKMIIHQDTGRSYPARTELFKTFLNQGGTILSLLGDSLSHDLGITFTSTSRAQSRAIKVHSQNSGEFDAAGSPFHTYTNLPDNCSPLLWRGQDVVGFKCQLGRGQLIQIGVLFYDIYNSDWYGKISDVKERNAFLREIIPYTPKIALKNSEEATVTAREVLGSNKLWLTIKNAKPTPNTITLSSELFKNFKRGTFLISGKSIKIAPEFSITMDAYGSDVLLLELAND
jgi:hypothetical protein